MISCSHNPTDSSDQGYRLPTSLFTGTLTGKELLFRSIDSRDSRGLEHVEGVFAADADGSNVRRLCDWKSYGYSSPAFLEDGRVVCIFEPKLPNDARDLVILAGGKTIHLNVPTELNNSITWCQPLRGPNANKILYYIYPNSFYVHDLSTGTTDSFDIPGYNRNCTARPAILADGRFAYIDMQRGSVRVQELSGNSGLEIPLPESFSTVSGSVSSGELFCLSSRRFLVAQMLDYTQYDFYISRTDSSGPWDYVTGFVPGRSPKKPNFMSGLGLRLFEEDQLAYTHEDEYSEPNATFSILSGRI